MTSKNVRKTRGMSSGSWHTIETEIGAGRLPASEMEDVRGRWRLFEPLRPRRRMIDHLAMECPPTDQQSSIASEKRAVNESDACVLCRISHHPLPCPYRGGLLQGKCP
jgi:hypothetical protein